MAKDLGPDMLARLEARRAAGELSQAECDAKRIEVEELIRRGKTIDVGTPRRVIAGLSSAVLGVVGLGLVVVGPTIGAKVIGLVMLVAAFFGWRSLR